MIEIVIKSPRGEGATATAIAIARMLKDSGSTVLYVGRSKSQSRAIQDQIDSSQPLLTHARKVTITDLGAKE